VDHRDLLELLRGGVPADGGGVWADMGSGGGAFTVALSELAGPSAEIWSVDRDPGALRGQRDALDLRLPGVAIKYLEADFRRPLQLPPLDGVVMANSLHFARDKGAVLELVRGYLKPGGRLVLVEYDADRGNPWVPHPLSYSTWERVAAENGFLETRLLHRVPSRHLGAIYSALSRSPGASPAKQPTVAS